MELADILSEFNNAILFFQRQAKDQEQRIESIERNMSDLYFIFGMLFLLEMVHLMLNFKK